MALLDAMELTRLSLSRLADGSLHQGWKRRNSLRTVSCVQVAAFLGDVRPSEVARISMPGKRGIKRKSGLSADSESFGGVLVEVVIV